MDTSDQGVDYTFKQTVGHLCRKVRKRALMPPMSNNYPISTKMCRSFVSCVKQRCLLVLLTCIYHQPWLIMSAIIWKTRLEIEPVSFCTERQMSPCIIGPIRTFYHHILCSFIMHDYFLHRKYLSEIIFIIVTFIPNLLLSKTKFDLKTVYKPWLGFLNYKVFGSNIQYAKGFPAKDDSPWRKCARFTLMFMGDRPCGIVAH